MVGISILGGRPVVLASPAAPPLPLSAIPAEEIVFFLGEIQKKRKIDRYSARATPTRSGSRSPVPTQCSGFNSGRRSGMSRQRRACCRNRGVIVACSPLAVKSYWGSEIWLAPGAKTKINFDFLIFFSYNLSPSFSRVLFAAVVLVLGLLPFSFPPLAPR